MNDIIYQTIIAFLSSVAFIWARTYNVHATSQLDIPASIKSGIIIHLLWLVSISIGANGAYKVLVDYDWNYIPVILGSLIGSILGGYIGLIKRIKSVKKKKKLNNI